MYLLLFGSVHILNFEKLLECLVFQAFLHAATKGHKNEEEKVIIYTNKSVGKEEYMETASATSQPRWTTSYIAVASSCLLATSILGHM